MEKIVEERINSWLNGAYDEETKKEIRDLIDSKNEKELTDAFYRDLEFGTGGLRGIMGVGSNRMNKYTVGKATQGLANYILKQNGESFKVAIGYDSRNNSDIFSKTAAEILSSNGIKVYLYDDIHPISLLSYAVRSLGCIAGIVVTASHNPKEYNGYKVYWTDGAQVIPPHDKNIIDEVLKVKPEEVKLGDNSKVSLIGKDIEDKYMNDLMGYLVNPNIIKKHNDIKIVLNEEGIPIEFYGEEKKQSAHIIEELMLLANSEIAKKLKDYDGAIFRYHGLPDEYRFNNFKILAHNKGYELKKLENGGYDIKEFIERVKGKAEENLLTSVLLRSMTPSSYSIVNKSHFGLGLDYYTYFTSPIRRYSDLLIHRIVKSVLINKDKEIDLKLKDLCKDSFEKLSILDKTSNKAERNVRQVKAARFMKDRLGDEYFGIISSMSKNGITVEIEGLEIEGFIDSHYVGSDYRFYQDMQCVFIEKVKAYELGDRVKIFVASVNVENGKINFSL